MAARTSTSSGHCDCERRAPFADCRINSGTTSVPVSRHTVRQISGFQLACFLAPRHGITIESKTRSRWLGPMVDQRWHSLRSRARFGPGECNRNTHPHRRLHSCERTPSSVARNAYTRYPQRRTSARTLHKDRAISMCRPERRITSHAAVDCPCFFEVTVGRTKACLARRIHITPRV